MPVEHRFGPPLRLIILGWLAAAALAFLALLSSAAGAILAGLAALAVLAEALRSTVVRDSLVVRRDGLAVSTGMRRVELGWADIRAVRAVRLGHLVPAAALEIETYDRAYVVSAFRLGVPARQVVAAVEAWRPA
ncbi:MAG: PH domain-containing protein [Mycobacteriales bacterium]